MKNYAGKKSTTLLLILGVLFWSGNYVLGRALVHTVPPLTLSYIRWIMAFLCFLPFAWREMRANLQAVRANLPYLIILGSSGIVGYNFFQYLAVKYTAAVNASMINSSTPMFTAIFAYFFLKDGLRWRQMAGIGLSLSGVLVIMTRGDWHNFLALSFNKGDLFMLAAVLLNTVYLLLLKGKGSPVPPKTLFLTTVAGGLAVTFPFPIIENILYGTGWTHAWGWPHTIGLIYLAIFPSILSMLFFNRAIADLGPVKTAAYVNLGIVFSAILGIIFLGEMLTPAHFLGGILIVAGIWLTGRSKPALSAEKEEAALARRLGDGPGV